MKINKIGRRVTCPSCGWRDPELHTTGKFAGWLKCQNPLGDLRKVERSTQNRFYTPRTDILKGEQGK